MSRIDVLPHDAFAALIADKITGLGPYEHAPCTDELDALSTQLYGGNIFGENATATCNQSSSGPMIHFWDRAIIEHSGHGAYPLKVATLDREGLYVSSENVFLDWITKREVIQNSIGETTFAITGLREAARNSKLSRLDQLKPAIFSEITPTAIDARIASSIGPMGYAGLAAPEKISQRRQHIANLAMQIDHPNALDLAEVLATENQSLPHVLRTPDAATALENVLGENGHTLPCKEDGLWAAVTWPKGFGGVRSETFLPCQNYRDKLIDELEKRTYGESGQRLIKAVGSTFDESERANLVTLGKSHNANAIGTWGAIYATPFTIEHGALPHGTSWSGEIDNVPYRVYIPA